MSRFDLPDEPPSARLLPPAERRERARTLDWMHEAAAPRRKKRVDAPAPAVETLDERRARLYREALGRYHELDDPE